MKLGDPKNVFWEALLLTVVVFFFGLLIGYAVEESRFTTVDRYYAQSEISLMDIFTLNSFTIDQNSSCDVLVQTNLDFADRIYKEAQILDSYEQAGKISTDLELAHKKYDLLRTILWVNSIKVREHCGNELNSVVYLYQQNTPDLAQKATQNVWSKVLFDFKQKNGGKIVLIPISTDSNLISLRPLIDKYHVERFPTVIINDQVISQLSSVEELDKYLT
ncbi:MAG: hypothetical protein AABW63_00650 [Nanoarchaeota archaeon]